MPINRPALALGPGPRGVQDARRWVLETCEAIGRPELAECAQLGVSELVTNALLHGEPPITVGVRGTVEHPRIEVRDRSREAPVLPSAPLETEELDELLLTFGRGLGIVARSSTAWGADIDEDGKVVWFAPAAEFSDDDGVEGVITGLAAEGHGPRRTPGSDDVQVVVRDVPLKTYLGFQRHFRELRREVRLLALAHESDYPLAKNLSDLFGSLERQLRDVIGLERIEDRVAAGQRTADLEVEIPRADATTLGRFLELLDLADEFCREERLLSLARVPEQRRFQAWFFGEFIRQAGGENPVAWDDNQGDRRRSVVS